MNKKRLLALVLAMALVLGMVPLSKTEAATVSFSDYITVNLFDYGSMINAREEMPFNLTGASATGASFDFPFYTSTVVSGKIADYAGIGGLNLGAWPVLVNGYPALPRNDDSTKYISAGFMFDKSLTAQTQSPYDLAVEITPDDTSYNGKTFTTKINETRKVPMYEVIRYEVNNAIFKENDSGYLSFDSKSNHAWYDYDTQSLVVENYAVRPENVDVRYQSMGHFLPFTGDILEDTSYVLNEDYDKLETKPTPTLTSGAKYTAKDLASRYTTSSELYAINMGQNNYSKYACQFNTQDLDNDKLVNMWIGMSAEFSFNQQENGKKDGEEIVYEFTGDDYLFVYIDDVMVLDIGLSGDHTDRPGGAKTATINFSTGDVVVYRVDNSPADIDTDGDGKISTAELNAANVTEGDTTGYIAYKTNLRTLFETAKNEGYIDSIPEFKEGTNTFADFTSHSFKLFYLDSGHGTSNCMMEFNLDPIPTNDVTLEKQVTGINPALSDDQTYTFTMTGKNANGQELTNIAYETNLGNSGSISNGGTISLSAGEKATLKDVPAGSDISFTENKDGKSGIIESTSWTCEGSSYTEGTEIDLPNNDNSLDFVCTNVRVTYDLTVSKNLEGDSYAAAANDEFEFSVEIAGNKYTGLATKSQASDLDFDDATGTVKIKANESFTITNIPSGMSYQVTESEPQDHVEYVYDAPKYDSVETDKATGSMNADTTVTVTNTLRLLYGNLKITKSGIEAVDHDAAADGDEHQSTIFRIYGTSDSGVSIDMKVAVHGNNAVTIKDLPVGDYTVEEISDWSWRYEPENSETVTVRVNGGATAEASFKNVRKIVSWLSGDNFIRNLFNQIVTG